MFATCPYQEMNQKTIKQWLMDNASIIIQYYTSVGKFHNEHINFYY